jgi:hypothetical protein
MIASTHRIVAIDGGVVTSVAAAVKQGGRTRHAVAGPALLTRAGKIRSSRRTVA